MLEKLDLHETWRAQYESNPGEQPWRRAANMAEPGEPTGANPFGNPAQTPEPGFIEDAAQMAARSD